MAAATTISPTERREEVHANYEAFIDHHVNSLLEHHEGDWALLSDKKLIAVYATLDEAHEDGTIKYPDRRSPSRRSASPDPCPWVAVFFEGSYDSPIGPVLPEVILQAENGNTATVKGLLDTGCTITAITPRVIAQLELEEPFSQVEVWTPSGTILSQVYFLRFGFTQGTPHWTRAIGAMPPDQQRLSDPYRAEHPRLLQLDGVNSRFSFSIRPEDQISPTPPELKRIRRGSCDV